MPLFVRGCHSGMAPPLTRRTTPLWHAGRRRREAPDRLTTRGSAGRFKAAKPRTRRLIGHGPQGGTIRIRIAQTYPKLGDVTGNLEAIREAVESAASEEIDLIVFPELALTGYHLRDMVSSVALTDDHEVFGSLCALSERIAVVVGCVEESPDFRFYNTAFFLDGGRVVHRHRKVHLPTYGMFEEERYFGAGRRIRAFDTRFGRLGLLICEDALHPVNPYMLAQDGAETIVILSASPGRGVAKADGTDNASQWEALIHACAHALTVFVVYANRAGCEDGVSFWGGSRVVGPDGRVLAACGQFREGTIDAELERGALRRARIAGPYLRDERIDIVLNELRRIRDERSGD
jgi:predicted amidohydrolase